MSPSMNWGVMHNVSAAKIVHTFPLYTKMTTTDEDETNQGRGSYRKSSILVKCKYCFLNDAQLSAGEVIQLEYGLHFYFLWQKVISLFISYIVYIVLVLVWRVGLWSDHPAKLAGSHLGSSHSPPVVYIHAQTMNNPQSFYIVSFYIVPLPLEVFPWNEPIPQTKWIQFLIL